MKLHFLAKSSASSIFSADFRGEKTSWKPNYQSSVIECSAVVDHVTRQCNSIRLNAAASPEFRVGFKAHSTTLGDLYFPALVQIQSLCPFSSEASLFLLLRSCLVISWQHSSTAARGGGRTDAAEALFIQIRQFCCSVWHEIASVIKPAQTTSYRRRWAVFRRHTCPTSQNTHVQFVHFQFAARVFICCRLT